METNDQALSQSSTIPRAAANYFQNINKTYYTIQINIINSFNAGGDMNKIKLKIL